MYLIFEAGSCAVVLSLYCLALSSRKPFSGSLDLSVTVSRRAHWFSDTPFLASAGRSMLQSPIVPCPFLRLPGQGHRSTGDPHICSAGSRGERWEGFGKYLATEGLAGRGNGWWECLAVAGTPVNAVFWPSASGKSGPKKGISMWSVLQHSLDAFGVMTKVPIERNAEHYCSTKSTAILDWKKMGQNSETHSFK